MNVEYRVATRRSRLALALWGLLLLFVLRVVGQLLVALGLGGRLPPMAEWYSGLISYPWLLASQIIIIVLYGKICLDYTRGAGFFMRARRRAGVGLLIFGALYVASMLIRYGATMALYPQRRWTGGGIPVFFHFVLAAFILLVGRDYYVRSMKAEARRNSIAGDRARCQATSITSLITGGWRAQSGKSQT